MEARSQHTNICAVDKAEEVQKRNGRNDHEINLESKPALCSRINDDERASVSESYQCCAIEPFDE